MHLSHRKENRSPQKAGDITGLLPLMGRYTHLGPAEVIPGQVVDHPLVLIFQDAACMKKTPCAREGQAGGPGTMQSQPSSQGSGTGDSAGVRHRCPLRSGPHLGRSGSQTP